MKKLVLFILLSMLVSACGEKTSVGDQSYPWQIRQTAKGNTQVFGIELDAMPLGHTKRVLNTRYELGLFEDRQGKLSLEAFYSEVTLGGLSGKMVLLLKADQAQLGEFKAHSRKAKPQESGVMKYRLSAADSIAAEQLIVTSLSYIPYVNLDQDIIHKRFGEADKVIKTEDGLTHYLYMNKGLEIIQDDDGKELLQYVSPSNIKVLLQPLQQQFQ